MWSVHFLGLRAERFEISFRAKYIAIALQKKRRTDEVIEKSLWKLVAEFQATFRSIRAGIYTSQDI